jgi:hypothetical protein
MSEPQHQPAPHAAPQSAPHPAPQNTAPTSAPVEAHARPRTAPDRSHPSPRPSPLARGLGGLIYLYQITLAPFLGGRCRFFPSCSAYAAEALATHGALRGSWLAAKRLARCHPLGGHGIDLVPPARRAP